MLSSSIQRYTAKFAYLVAIIGSLVFAYFSVELFIEAYEIDMIDERGADFLLWTLLLPMPISFTLVAVEFIRFLLGFDDMYGKRTDLKESM